MTNETAIREAIPTGAISFVTLLLEGTTFAFAIE